jgi:hypothetical protein
MFVCQGVIEAGCRTVIGSQLKQPEMFWTIRGANAVLALRSYPFNNRFRHYFGDSLRS